jgi:hypothetical protein
MRPLREVEKPNPLFQVSLICGLVLLYRAEKQVLFLTPLGGLSIKEACVYLPIKLVHIHSINPSLKPSVFRVKAGNGRIVVSLCVTMTLAEGLCHPVHHLIIQNQTF